MDWDAIKIKRVDKLGEGSYGTVYGTNRPGIVVKIAEHDGVEMWDTNALREVAAARRMHWSPRVMKALHVQGDGNAVRVFTPRQVCDLSCYIKRATSNPDVRRIMYQIACGMRDMHAAGLAHRDLKPQNILVTTLGDIVIADLGMTRATPDHTLPLTGAVMTLWYRAPEVLLGAPYTQAIDVWSLGVLMIDLLTRSTYQGFRGDSDIDQMFKIFKMRGTPDDHRWPGVSKFAHYKPTWPKWDPASLPDEITSDPRARDLLHRMLELVPERRITMAQVIEHAYFQEYVIPPLLMLRVPPVNPEYMNLQPDLNSRMRFILVDWLMEVALRFKYKPATLFLAVQIVDRFSMERQIKRTQYQLVGIAALMLAAKICEVSTYGLADYVAVCDRAYAAVKVNSMQDIILSTLAYNVYFETEHTAIARADAGRRNFVTRQLTRALLELSSRRYDWDALISMRFDTPKIAHPGWKHICREYA